MTPTLEKIIASLQSGFDKNGVRELCDNLKNLNPVPGANGFYEAVYKIGEKTLAANLMPEALILFGFCYRGGFNWNDSKKVILNNFYSPFACEFKKTYEKNVSNLIKYKYIKKPDFPPFDDLKYRFLRHSGPPDSDAVQFGMMNVETGSFSLLLSATRNFLTAADTLNQKGNIILLNDIYDTSFIEWALNDTFEPLQLPKKIPMYIFFKNFSKFAEYLQVFDFEKCLAKERLLFIFGRQNLYDTIVYSDIMPPVYHLSAPDADEAHIDELFIAAAARKAAEAQKMSDMIAQYYQSLTPERISNMIAEKNVRIAFFTTRFSTAIQYFARDCVLALKKLGYNAELIIEESDIAFNHVGIYRNCFASYKPEIVIVINCNRSVVDTPAQISFICWIQDFLPSLFSKNGALQIGKNDFIMNLIYSSDELRELGYPSDKMIAAPAPVNPDIYRKHELTEKEKTLYSTDVCYISNSGDMELSFKSFVKSFENFSNRNFIEKNFKALSKRIFDDIYHERKDYNDDEIIKSLLGKELEKNSVHISNDDFMASAHSFKFEFIGNILKVVPLLWLHEKGYKMKLWGKPWARHPILGKYAMGEAKNGETMSKILNASKIALGQNNAVTLHPRLMESTLSGSLYIGNNIPAKFDYANAEKFFSEGKDYLRFYGRDDLYKKIDHFLENEGERKTIVENGRKKILESLTYEHLMKNVLEFVQKKLSETIKGENMLNE